MTEHIKSTIDNGNYGYGNFIDLKKTFDTVNHTILLKTFEHYGIRGKRFVLVNVHLLYELEINQSSDILQHSQNRPTGDRWLKF